MSGTKSSAQPVVSRDIPCVTCGYNLRTLPADSRCPECGTAVIHSLPTTEDPNHFRRAARVASRAGWLNIASMVMALFFLLASFGLTWIDGGSYANMPVLENVIHEKWILSFVPFVCLALLHLWAAWVATSQPLQRDFHLPPVKMTRYSGVLIALATLVPFATVWFVIAFLAALPLLTQYACLKALFQAAWVFPLALLSPFVFYYGRHFAGLCNSGGFPSLAAWHRGTSRFLAVGIALLSVGYLFMGVEDICRVADVHTIQEFLNNIAWLTGLLFYGGFLGFLMASIAFLTITVLLFRTAERFRRRAHELTTSTPTPETPH